MAIKYFPNRVFKKNTSPVDRLIKENTIYTIVGQQNTVSTALDTYVSSNTDWNVNSIKLNFNNNTSTRHYTVDIASGVKIVENLNDSLWFISGSSGAQIILDPGFYIGTEMATELQTKLGAIWGGITVAYDDETGSFTITPASGTIQYLQTNRAARLPLRDSTGGFLFGLTQNSNLVSSLVSDTNVYGLNTEAWIIDETNSETEHYHDTDHELTMDQALHIQSNVATTTITYEIRYEEID